MKGKVFNTLFSTQRSSLKNIEGYITDEIIKRAEDNLDRLSKLCVRAGYKPTDTITGHGFNKQLIQSNAMIVMASNNFGTASIPPRPFMDRAAHDESIIDVMNKLFKEYAKYAPRGDSRINRETRNKLVHNLSNTRTQTFKTSEVEKNANIAIVSINDKVAAVSKGIAMFGDKTRQTIQNARSRQSEGEDIKVEEENLVLVDLSKEAVKSLNIDRIMNLVGEKMVKRIRDHIYHGVYIQNSPYTIENKGGTRTLYDTGDAMKVVKYWIANRSK